MANYTGQYMALRDASCDDPIIGTLKEIAAEISAEDMNPNDYTFYRVQKIVVQSELVVQEVLKEAK